MAKIVLENMEFYAFHGCYAEERVVGATFLVTLEMEADLEAASRSDNLCDTINYEAVYQIVKSEMQQPSNLIEHVTYRIKHAVCTAFPQLTAVSVSVSKLAPPLGGKIDRATVVV